MKKSKNRFTITITRSQLNAMYKAVVNRRCELSRYLEDKMIREEAIEDTWEALYDLGKVKNLLYNAVEDTK